MKAKTLYSLMVLALLLSLLGMAYTISLAEGSQDKSSTIHTFLNHSTTDTYNDLHIEYTTSIDAPASNPQFTPAGGAAVSGWTRSAAKLDITGSFPPSSSVTVTAYSTIANLKVKQYYWTIGGTMQGPLIPVYYEDITAGKDGRFSAFVLVHKPSYTVDVTVTGTVNIVGGVGGVTVSKTASGSDTTVTFSGELANTNIKGEVTSIIDPSNVTEDWVIGIFPFVGGITAVGGIAVPVDKLGLLAPYIGFASTIAIAGVATAVYVKRVKHKKEKQ